MQVKIKDGEEQLILTKRERDTLRNAAALLASIGRHIQPKEMADSMHNAGCVVDAFLVTTNEPE